MTVEDLELCRKYPPGTGFDTHEEYERFCDARERVVSAMLKLQDIARPLCMIADLLPKATDTPA